MVLKVTHHHHHQKEDSNHNKQNSWTQQTKPQNWPGRLLITTLGLPSKVSKHYQLKLIKIEKFLPVT